MFVKKMLNLGKSSVSNLKLKSKEAPSNKLSLPPNFSEEVFNLELEIE